MPTQTQTLTSSDSKRRNRIRRETAAIRSQFYLPAAILIVLLGTWLRIAGAYSVQYRSPDENTYAMEAALMHQHGVAGLREAVDRFRHDPSMENLPRPSRVVYLWMLNLTMSFDGDTSAASGVPLSCAASIASLLLVGLIGWRFLSPGPALFAMFFYAVSPIERIFAQRTWQESVIECVALSLVYIASRILEGARSAYWFAAFALLGATSLGLKEIATLWAACWFFCIVWSLLRSANRSDALLFSCWCVAGAAAVLVAMGWAIGGLNTLVELTTGNLKALSANPYSLEFEAGPPWMLAQILFSIIPVVLVFAIPGTALAWKRDHSESGLVRAELVVRLMALNATISLLLAALTPHHLNIRYIAPALGSLYLLGGLGFCWCTRAVYRRLHGLEQPVLAGLAVMTILLGAGIDLKTFSGRLTSPAVVDLSAKMVLDATDPAGPIRSMPRDEDADLLKAAQATQLREPSTRHLLDLAIALERLGRYDDSIRTAQEVILIQPDSAEAYNVVSAANLAQEHWDAAIQAASSALAINPKYQLAMNNLQWARHQRQSLER